MRFREFTESEFSYWLNGMKTKGFALPSKQFAEAKEKKISDAVNYKYTDKDINEVRGRLQLSQYLCETI